MYALNAEDTSQMILRAFREIVMCCMNGLQYMLQKSSWTKLIHVYNVCNAYNNCPGMSI